MSNLVHFSRPQIKPHPFQYRREIDGLRALAVLPVIFFHAGFSTFGGGFVGVDVFFVISGYLITSIVVQQIHEDRFSFLNFYERRARRILPALLLVLLLCLPFSWFLLLPHELKKFANSLAAVVLFVSNHLFSNEVGYFDTAAELKPLLHTWSLAVEEQFYFAFPIILILCWRFGRFWVLFTLTILSIASLSLAETSTKLSFEQKFYLIPTRAWELLIGSIAAIATKDKTFALHRHAYQLFSATGFCLILYSIFFFSRDTPFPSIYTLVPIAGATLVIVFANESNWTGKLLACKPLVGIGLISYSAYLLHQPLFSFARHANIHELSVPYVCLLILITLLLAYASWKYVETPCRNVKKVSTPKLLILCIGTTVFLISTAWLIRTQEGFPKRLTQQANATLAVAGDRNYRINECLLDDRKNSALNRSCFEGNASNVKGVLLGDSHAFALSAALGQELTERKIGFKIHTLAGCPPVLDIYNVADVKDTCYKHTIQAYSEIITDPKIEYVLLSARWAHYLEFTPFNNQEGGQEAGVNIVYDAIDKGEKQVNSTINRQLILRARFAKSIQKLLDHDKKVILLYPIPEVAVDVPKYVAKALQKGNNSDFALTTSLAVYQVRNKSALDALNSIADHSNLIRINPQHLFCDSYVKDRCITDIGKIPLYYDDDHLSHLGAKLVVREIFKELSIQ